MNKASAIIKSLVLIKMEELLVNFSLDSCFAFINKNEQVRLFTQTIPNIISNYIPRETTTCDDSNPNRQMRK